MRYSERAFLLEFATGRALRSQYPPTWQRFHEAIQDASLARDGYQTALAEEIQRDYANCVFFTSKLVFRNENWITRLLHNQTALALQRRLHLNGMQMVILPMQL